MKPNIILVFALAALLASTGSLHAQRSSYEITNILVDTPYSPDISSNYGKRWRAQNWIEIEVEFKADSGTKEKITEELTFKYYVFFDQVQPLTVFTGEVTHVNVPDGRGLYSVMYISPQTLNKVLGGRAVSKTSVKHIGIQILRNGQLVAEQSTSGAPKGQWWTTAPNVAGALRNKNETPFMPLVWDRYPEIKVAR